MLHSLAHMLLTRISLDCGYPATALRERIYALSDVGTYGILVHTGTSAEHDASAEHDPMHLLGAACHGCLLIAETSCEQRNDWLDRALVVSTLAVTDAAFFP
jgi:hypothetical protein